MSCLMINVTSFNDTLTNDNVSFEQLGPEVQVILLAFSQKKKKKKKKKKQKKKKKTSGSFSFSNCMYA